MLYTLADFFRTSEPVGSGDVSELLIRLELTSHNLSRLKLEKKQLLSTSFPGALSSALADAPKNQLLSCALETTLQLRLYGTH